MDENRTEKLSFAKEEERRIGPKGDWKRWFPELVTISHKSLSFSLFFIFVFFVGYVSSYHQSLSNHAPNSLGLLFQRVLFVSCFCISLSFSLSFSFFGYFMFPRISDECSTGVSGNYFLDFRNRNGTAISQIISNMK